MLKKVSIKTKKEDIVDYWFTNIDESDFSVDASEALERCWRCGYKRKLQRCHIIPDSLGGKDEPSNYVLLCERCHIDNPNVNDTEIMWDWLKAYKVSIYDTFWSIQGIQEYKRIYGKSINEEFIERNVKEEDIGVFKNMLKSELDKTSWHYGHPYLNVATIAALYRMTLKKWDELMRSKVNL
ncbi:HNH endonuclease [Petrocella atlantisensis]|uniref:HNH endonuclease n=1 Tax=Petrocella atlantisensis TaxID=2173034 RepID=A0A3P7NUW3_9FIRM|nr:HNH endonuclease [Petrocella atlantisensis]